MVPLIWWNLGARLAPVRDAPDFGASRTATRYGAVVESV